MASIFLCCHYSNSVPCDGHKVSADQLFPLGMESLDSGHVSGKNDVTPGNVDVNVFQNVLKKRLGILIVWYAQFGIV